MSGICRFWPQLSGSYQLNLALLYVACFLQDHFCLFKQAGALSIHTFLHFGVVSQPLGSCLITGRFFVDSSPMERCEMHFSQKNRTERNGENKFARKKQTHG